MFSSHRLFQNAKLLLQSCLTEMSRTISYRLVIISQFTNQGISLLCPAHLFTPFFLQEAGWSAPKSVHSINAAWQTLPCCLNPVEWMKFVQVWNLCFSSTCRPAGQIWTYDVSKIKGSIASLNKSATISLSFSIPVPKKESWGKSCCPHYATVFKNIVGWKKTSPSLLFSVLLSSSLPPSRAARLNGFPSHFLLYLLRLPICLSSLLSSPPLSVLDIFPPLFLSFSLLLLLLLSWQSYE